MVTPAEVLSRPQGTSLALPPLPVLPDLALSYCPSPGPATPAFLPLLGEAWLGVGEQPVITLGAELPPAPALVLLLSEPLSLP